MCNLPRVIISAPNSGCGKTIVVCAILQALINRKVKVCAYKCGPDYIDTMFHSKIIGTKGRNLDLFFSTENEARSIFCTNSQDGEISIIEGAMGYYDGVGGTTTQASAYHVSQALDAPTILVVKPSGASVSIAAVVCGMKQFRKDSNIKAVILNECSEHLYKMLAPIIENETGVSVIGYLPKMSGAHLESRHLGLVTADEISELKEKINAVATQAERTVGIEKLMNIANCAEDIFAQDMHIEKAVQNEPTIAVARDEAFCFYYEDNLEILRKMGAKIVEFSPLRDKKLPSATDAIYLGGGYPELFAAKLSENNEMLCAINDASKAKMPIFAECGGFMYLHEKLQDISGDEYSMCRVCKGISYYTGKLARFGYITLKAKKNSIISSENDEIKAHEFHYFDSDNCGDAFSATKPISARTWDCVNADENVFAGFPHLYFRSNLDFPRNFINAASRYKGDKYDT